MLRNSACLSSPINRAWILLTFCILASLPEKALSQDERQSSVTTSDRPAISAIFDDGHIADAALSIHQRAAEMPIEQRYRYLSEWVLPGPGHGTIRTALDFTPTQPVRGKERMDVDRLKIAEQSGQSRVQIGGRLVSPAIDLVEAALELGRLDVVRQRVEQGKASASCVGRRAAATRTIGDTRDRRRRTQGFRRGESQSRLIGKSLARLRPSGIRWAVARNTCDLRKHSASRNA